MANIKEHEMVDYINNQKGVQVNIRFVQVPIDEGMMTELFTVFRRDHIPLRACIMPGDKIGILFSTNPNMAEVIIQERKWKLDVTKPFPGCDLREVCGILH